MQGLKVHNWEWVEWEIIDRHGRLKTIMKRMPREYKELPYEQPIAKLPDEDEKIVDF